MASYYKANVKNLWCRGAYVDYVTDLKMSQYDYLIISRAMDYTENGMMIVQS